ncbi:unnamed protein product [Candidula unifasciata]|uniref:Uncharacterized protein n=1 Tax=Candidula unifasciata TaxID=100452 RepID=A0A8S3YSH9_9EUPU|nr:unnamed protein product [Candidula unifasciata]
MECGFHILLIVTLVVAMVTSAPLTNQEKLVNVDQPGDKVNRAKRADEEIVFGNQQNKARVVAKKSDLSNLLVPAPLPGEVDQGSEVIVHKEMPVTDELAARAEAAVGSVRENNEKIKEAVEAALEAVAEDEAEKTETVTDRQEPVDKTDSDDKAIKQLIEDDIEENEQGAGEVSDTADENPPRDDTDDEDTDLKELQRTAESSAMVAAAATATAAGGNDESSNKASSAEEGIDSDEVEKFLQESQQPEDEGEVSLDRDRERSYVNQMRNFLLSLNNGRRYQRLISPYLERYRRSVDSSKKTAPSKNNKRTRRIKRDLLEDTSELYEPPFYSAGYQDPNPDSEDVVPLTDEEAEYLYNRLVNYLSDEANPEQEEVEPEEGSLDSYLNGYGEEDNEPYVPYTTYNDDDVSYVPNVYDDRYQYGPVSFLGLAKRGMIDYYPPEEEEKRYFFPFNKEPETHWGAFVPEKRSYDEAIQRLQRLALALSDNPGPYYREILEEYRRK